MVGYTFIKRHGTEDIANNVKLTISVDGAFLFKSCNGYLWPILGMLYLFSPFIVALYFRSNKPNEVDEFIHDIMDVYQKLKSVNFEHGNHNFIIPNYAVICDAPARQFSKSIRSHNSRYTCESSAVETEYFENV